MKKAMIACLALLSAFINAPTVLAEQNTETKVNMTVEPTYTISIPSSIQTNADPSLVKKERELTQFKVKATDVVLPGNSFIEVFVHAKNNPENKNVLINEDGRKLNFNFNRVANTKYGFSDNGNNNSGSGTWKIAEFHPITHDEHVTEAPVAMTTEDVLVTSGKYQNTLVFDISLTADMKEKETVTTPFTGVEKIETKEFYEGHEKVIQEARPKIEEIEYDVIYKDGVEVSRKESNRRTIQEGQNKVIEIGTRTEYDDWFDWTKTLPDHYVIASDSDFSGTTNGSFRYIGSDDYVVIPYRIKGIKPTSYYNMFNGTSVKGVATNHHSVTTMNNMFRGSSATKLDLSSFDTSSVTSMANMFHGSSATILDLSSFDTSEVVLMGSIFRDSSAIEINLNNFNTSNVRSMGYMFYGSQVLTIDLSHFDTSSVTDMIGMFNRSSAVSINLSNFNTSNVTNMSGMFNRSLVTYLDLSSFNTSKVTNMSEMFIGSLATEIDLRSFNTSNVTDMSSMFQSSSAITLDLGSFDTSKVTNTSLMFRDSSIKTGYARTQTDADKFNSSSFKPSGLNFVPKPKTFTGIKQYFGTWGGGENGMIQFSSDNIEKITKEIDINKIYKIEMESERNGHIATSVNLEVFNGGFLVYIPYEDYTKFTNSLFSLTIFYDF